MTTHYLASQPTDCESSWLVKIWPSGSSDNLIVLNKDCTIGNSPDCTLVLSEDGVDERHAKVVRAGDEYLLTDLASRSGTHANRSRIIEHRLIEGDIIRIGESQFKFLCQSSPELEYHKSLQGRAIRDGLTLAYNRSFMVEFLGRELERCSMHDRPLSVLMMDIDFFKKTNDTYGHQAGDQVLLEFAKRISPLLDADDILARYGGEEFAIVMCENSLADAVTLGNQILSVIRDEPFETTAAAIAITVSIGVAGITGFEDIVPQPDELLDAADRMLYRAKADGRDRMLVRESIAETATASDMASNL